MPSPSANCSPWELPVNLACTDICDAKPMVRLVSITSNEDTAGLPTAAPGLHAYIPSSDQQTIACTNGGWQSTRAPPCGLLIRSRSMVFHSRFTFSEEACQ